jgi:hypothetical protein
MIAYLIMARQQKLAAALLPTYYPSPSMTVHERVLDMYARDRLPCVEIFR